MMPSISKRLLTWSAPGQAGLLNFALPIVLSFFSSHVGWDEVPGTWNFTGVVLVAAGLALFTAAMLEQLRRMKNLQTVNITFPEQLIDTGPYRFTRNPLYLAGILTWLGWAIFFGSLLILAGSALILGITSLIVIPWEERNLETRFGDKYLEYKRTVRRWIGRRRPKQH
jgi:protein-S-isoprenylcysteine O-methyltransferase Ste14